MTKLIKTLQLRMLRRKRTTSPLRRAMASMTQPMKVAQMKLKRKRMKNKLQSKYQTFKVIRSLCKVQKVTWLIY